MASRLGNLYLPTVGRGLLGAPPAYCSRSFRVSGIHPIKSSGVMPYSPNFWAAPSPDKPWRYTAAAVRAAGDPNSNCFCPRNEVISPASTSPLPPLAMPGLPLVLILARPSGAAMMVRCPLSTRMQWWSLAKDWAAARRF